MFVYIYLFIYICAVNIGMHECNSIITIILSNMFLYILLLNVNYQLKLFVMIAINEILCEMHKKSVCINATIL